MSHYSVAVITKEVPTEDILNKALDPFDENLEVEPYIEYNFEEVKEELDGVDEDNLKKIFEQKDIKGLILWNELHNYYYEIDENGNALSTYNPNSKWDFWLIGGRWSRIMNGNDYMPLKEFPRVRPNDTEDDLRKKFPMIASRFKDMFDLGNMDGGILRNNSETLADYINERYSYAILTPDGVWFLC